MAKWIWAVMAAWLAMWGVFLIRMLMRDTAPRSPRTARRPLPWSLLDGGDPRP